uniref:Cilium assembly protein DZIP1 N-terminal domain-containing protein n=1 Tax=Meloidogyne incognita TaxID=6306 RepID=A0A914MYY1_MELIC
MTPINSNINDKTNSQQNDQTGKTNNIGQTQSVPSVIPQHQQMMPSLAYQQQHAQRLQYISNSMSNANKTTIQPQMFPTYPNPMSNPNNNSTTQPNVENDLWVVGNFSFQSGISTSDLHVNLRKNITIGKVNKLLTKTTLDTFKFIEELLVDDPSKKVVEDEGQIKKQIQESEIKHKKEIEDLKKECEKMKAKCSNWEYKHEMLLRQINKMKKDEIDKIKEVSKVSSQKSPLLKGFPQPEKSKDKTTLDVVEDEDPEIINDFDFVENDKNEEEENDVQHVEDE